MFKSAIKITILFLIVSCNYLYAQEGEKINYSLEELKGLYVGGNISTDGWGGEVKYLFNKRFTVKSGYETMNLVYNYDYEQENIDFSANVDYKTGAFYFLGDFNYTRSLYISAGFMFNSFNPTVTGVASSDLQYGDIVIPAEKIGGYTVAITPELQISPYASLGARGFMGKAKRVSVSTEIGCYYIGAPQVEITATGLVSPTADPAHGQKELLESQIDQYKFYPVLKLNLAVKLF